MTTEKTASQHAADAAVSHGDALAYHADGNASDANYSAKECMERVQRCHEAAAREGTADAREAALRGAGLLMTLPGRETQLASLRRDAELMATACNQEPMDGAYVRAEWTEIVRDLTALGLLG